MIRDTCHGRTQHIKVTIRLRTLRIAGPQRGRSISGSQFNSAPELNVAAVGGNDLLIAALPANAAVIHDEDHVDARGLGQSLRGDRAGPTGHDRAVQAAETARDAALNQAKETGQEAQQAARRAAAAQAHAATAEATRIRQDAASEFDQLRASAAAELDRLRADTARERDKLRELPQDQARHLTEARDTQRRRAERAEHDLDAARAELAQLRSKAATADASNAPRRRRAGQTAES
jgi:hypothetical protein